MSSVVRKHDRGPFDIIGDVHGCFDELVMLLEQLGYSVEGRGERTSVKPPAGRKTVFVGDLVDRGPKIPAVLRLVMGMVAAGTALCLPGNHDDKLTRALMGRKVKIQHGLEQSLEQLADESPEFKSQVRQFFESLPSHYLLDDGKLVVVHAGLKANLHGQTGKAVRSFALFGDTTGKLDEHGLPERRDWAAAYRGKPLIVYGHTPVAEAHWVNNTVNIDTGCVFGGSLTALRYPELETVAVKALRTYAESRRPFLPLDVSEA